MRKRRRLDWFMPPPSWNVQQRVESRVAKGGPNDCWIWTGPVGSNGYGKFVYKGKHRAAHRAAWEVHNKKPVPKGKLILHKCPGKHNPLCCNPAHLYPGTHAQNMIDKIANGTHKPGSQSTRAKINEETAMAIFADKRRTCDVALAFNVLVGTVCNIKSGFSWRHVTGLEKP